MTMHSKYDVRLVDEGTLDTVIQVRSASGSNRVRYSPDYAAPYRDRDGLTNEGFKALGEEAIEVHQEIFEGGLQL